MAIELSDRLQGLQRSVSYKVDPDNMVRALLPEVLEFSRKPEVMATGWLIAVCEWPPMEALREFLDDFHCTLGTRVEISHLAPVVAGSVLTITARCAQVVGARTRWTVEAWDEFELVATGAVECVVVDQERFEMKRVEPKLKVVRL